MHPPACYRNFEKAILQQFSESIMKTYDHENSYQILNGHGVCLLTDGLSGRPRGALSKSRM